MRVAPLKNPEVETLSNEQAARSPALVLSTAASDGRANLASFNPIANRAKGYPLATILPEGSLSYGAALPDQVKGATWTAKLRPGLVV